MTFLEVSCWTGHLTKTPAQSTDRWQQDRSIAIVCMTRRLVEACRGSCLGFVYVELWLVPRHIGIRRLDVVTGMEHTYASEEVGATLREGRVYSNSDGFHNGKHSGLLEKNSMNGAKYRAWRWRFAIRFVWVYSRARHSSLSPYLLRF